MKDTHKHYSGKITVKAIIFKDGQILICRGTQDGSWEFPGGRINEGESPEESLIREVKEELGLNIVVEKIVHACTSFQEKNNHWQMLIAYEASIVGSADIVLDLDEIVEVQWVVKGNLKNIAFYNDCLEVVDKYLATK